ncbi:MAG: hypothetical protein ACE15B_16995 [Bryobacteraceae bacterium]
MRRTTLAAILAACALLAGCKQRQVRVQQTEEEAPQLATTVHVADPRAAAQLVSGFYDIEQGSWRWTAGKFAVVLRTPRGSAQKGAVLKLKFNIPDAVMGKLGPMAVAASVEGTALKPETYTQPGEYIYSRELAPEVMARDSARVDFHLDKFLPAGAVDSRELGVVVISAGFETK